MGIAPNIGDTLTYLILTNDTQQVIAHSTVRPFDEDHPNQRLDSLQDEGSTAPSTDENSEQHDIGNPNNESIHLAATDSEDGLLVSTNDILSQQAPIVKGWTPTRYNSDFWYRDAGDHYEYLAGSLC